MSALVLGFEITENVPLKLLKGLHFNHSPRVSLKWFRDN